MSCERYRDWILSDYLDDELELPQKKELEGHLAQCGKCKDFALKVKQVTVEPFYQGERLEPSPHVWANIRESLGFDVSSTRIPAQTTWWDKVRLSFLFPRPAFALATIILVLMVLTLTTYRNRGERIVQTDLEDDMDYLVSLVDDSDQNGGYGTAIEEYFL